MYTLRKYSSFAIALLFIYTLLVSLIFGWPIQFASQPFGFRESEFVHYIYVCLGHEMKGMEMNIYMISLILIYTKF